MAFDLMFLRTFAARSSCKLVEHAAAAAAMMPFSVIAGTC
jgi:hypothetical protein